MYANDYLHGIDVDAFSVSALIHCACARENTYHARTHKPTHTCMPTQDCLHAGCMFQCAFQCALACSQSQCQYPCKEQHTQKNAMIFSMQAYAEKLRIAQNYQESEYDQHHLINWWLIARALIDHGLMQWIGAKCSLMHGSLLPNTFK